MKRFKVSDLLIGLIFTLLFISIAVVITINFRPLYYLDLRFLNIEGISGLSRNEILQNYNALIDYSSPFFSGKLVFPTLPASESGLGHFKDVKNIFTFFYILGGITLVPSIIIFIRKAKNKDYSFLFVSSVMAIVLPTILGVFMAINFDEAFIVFHKIAFRNNDWLFDPSTDPVINILPDTFFLHCAVMIILIVLLFSILAACIYFSQNKHFSINDSENKG